MSAATATLVNAAALVGLSLWAYFANGMSSETTLIPVAFGLILAAHAPWMKAGSLVALILVTLLTAVILFALFTPLSSAWGKGEALPILRVSLMTATSAISLVVLIAACVKRLHRAR